MNERPENERPVNEKRLAFARMLGSAVLSQAILSAASFVVGLLLIRYTTDHQYGYYILASNAVLLLISLHGSFVNPALVRRMMPLAPDGRRNLVGGLYREQTQAVGVNTLLALLVAGALWSMGVFDNQTGPLVVVTVAATFAVLQRNFFRMVLAAHRRPHDVLLTDVTYVALLLVGTLVAIRTPHPAIATMAVMCVAAAISGLFTAHAMWRFEPWNVRGEPGILRSIAPLAALSTMGAAIHWTFSQGYMYVAAGMLDIAAVAAIAGTRLLMMPINLLSSGIGTLMLPLTAGWMQKHGAAFAFRRLVMFGAGMAGIALCYFLVLWLTRDWIFTEVLQKDFEHRDQLLLLWALAFLPMVVRDQLIYLLVANERFRQLTSLVFAGAVVSLLSGYIGMKHFGVVGAPLGVFVGELISLTGILVLSLRFIAPPGRQHVATDAV